MAIADHELRFRQWLGEHTGLLLKVVRSFAEAPADQDDLFQEILLQVWLSLPNFRDDPKPTTWALAWPNGIGTALNYLVACFPDHDERSANFRRPGT